MGPHPEEAAKRPSRRIFVLVFGMPLLVSGCGWTPLYADAEETPANTELRAIRVDPIAERIGQKLEIALRNSLAPAGEPVRRTGLVLRGFETLPVTVA